MTDFERAREAVAKMDAAEAAYKADRYIPPGMDYSPKAYAATVAKSNATAACIAYVRSGGWRRVEDGLPEDGQLVLVGWRQGDEDRIGFDARDEGGWAEHDAAREHFLAVGGSAAAGPDAICVGPAEEAPYTHWMPVPLPPPPSEKVSP